MGSLAVNVHPPTASFGCRQLFITRDTLFRGTARGATPESPRTGAPSSTSRVACKNRNKMMDAAVTVQHYSIGDLSREFDVTPRTIRFYEDRGLLAPQRRGQNRVYTPRDTAEPILRGSASVSPLRKSARSSTCTTRPTVNRASRFVGKIRARKAALEDQARDLAAVLEELNEVEQRHGVDDAKRRRLN